MKIVLMLCGCMLLLFFIKNRKIRIKTRGSLVENLV
jgi:hypothetical protein